MFIFAGAHPEVFEDVKSRDEEAVHQMLVDKTDSDVDSKVLAVDVMFPKSTKRPKKPGPKKSDEERDVSNNLLAIMFGQTCIPLIFVEDESVQRWVHSIDPEVNIPMIHL